MAISFHDALRLSKGEKVVLLGNGFSIACDDVFNYRSLLENANLDDAIHNVFANLETSDFEVIINKFESAAQLINLYTNDEHKLAEQFNDVSQTLKNQFAHAISEQHVDFSQVFRVIVENNIIHERSCFSFLQNFSKIFTTNYDLLLYWSIMKSFDRGNPENRIIIPTNDGFTRPGDDQPLRYIGGKQQNIFYLHGSLFLLQDGFDILKMERDVQEGLNLLPIILNNIRDGNILPLIVLEGSSANKLSKISKHLYLSDAINNLSKCSGSLFIHGHSLDQSDQHIFDAICQSSFKQIFISVLNEEALQPMERLANLRFGNNSNRQIYMYEALSANVWV